MEETVLECPMCGLELDTKDDAFVCAKHGVWYKYGRKLLVRAPREESLASEPVAMPWEQSLPATPVL